MNQDSEKPGDFGLSEQEYQEFRDESHARACAQKRLGNLTLEQDYQKFMVDNKISRERFWGGASDLCGALSKAAIVGLAIGLLFRLAISEKNSSEKAPAVPEKTSIRVHDNNSAPMP